MFVTSIVKSTALARARQGLPPELPGNREEQEADPVPVEEQPEPGNMPDFLLHPGGFLEEMTDWINAGAHRPQPILALGAALAAMGTVMGRKVRTESNLRTNLYIVGIGETSCGKEHARQCIKALLSAAECDEYLGPENLASDSGLLVAVYKQPAMLLMIDEIGWLLKSITSQYSKPYMKAIAQVLMQLHSSAGGVMKGKSYADKERKQENIQQPNVCLYGTSVPGRFHSSLTRDEVEDGFVPRMLVFESEDPAPKRRRVRTIPPPERLVQLVRYWHERRISCQSTFSRMAGNPEVPDPRELRLDSEAEEAFNLFEEFVREQAAEARPRGVAGLWGKTEATAVQVAMIHALSLDPEAKFIGKASAEWGIDLVSFLTRKMVRMAERNLNANQYEADVMMVLKVIEQAGGKIGHTALRDRCRRFSQNQFRDIMATLAEAGRVVEEVTQGLRGPKGRLYKINKGAWE